MCDNNLPFPFLAFPFSSSLFLSLPFSSFLSLPFSFSFSFSLSLSFYASFTVIVFCTGYIYDFPFLPCKNEADNDQDIFTMKEDQEKEDSSLPQLVVSANGHCVNDLVGHVFPASSYAPTTTEPMTTATQNQSLSNVAFVGLPYGVVPFHLYELQSRWIGRVIQARELALSQVEKIEAAAAAAGGGAAASSVLLKEKEVEETLRKVSTISSGRDDHYAHKMKGELQWEYCKSLIAEITELERMVGQQGVEQRHAEDERVGKGETDVVETEEETEEELSAADCYQGETLGRYVVLLLPPSSRSPSQQQHGSKKKSSSRSSRSKRQQAKTTMGTAKFYNKKKRRSSKEEKVEMPPRLARIIGGRTDSGHVNVEIFVPLHPEDDDGGLDYESDAWEEDLRRVKYVPLYPHHRTFVVLFVFWVCCFVVFFCLGCLYKVGKNKKKKNFSFFFFGFSLSLSLLSLLSLLFVLCCC